MAGKYLTKELIHSSVERLQIPKSEMVVVGGAALQLFGIKRSRDIDVVVAGPTLLEYTAQASRGRVNGHRVDHAGAIEIVGDRVQYVIEKWENFYDAVRIGHTSLMAAPNDSLYTASFEELRDEAIDIGGLPVSPVERILEWKLAVGRPKDLTDAQKIQNHLVTAPVSV